MKDMRKTILGMLFFFGTLIGGYVYLDNTYFLEIRLCQNEGGGWNYEDNFCATLDDITACRKSNGVWIEEENLCDFGGIIN